MERKTKNLTAKKITTTIAYAMAENGYCCRKILLQMVWCSTFLLLLFVIVFVCMVTVNSYYWWFWVVFSLFSVAMQANPLTHFVLSILIILSVFEHFEHPWKCYGNCIFVVRWMCSHLNHHLTRKPLNQFHPVG